MTFFLVIGFFFLAQSSFAQYTPQEEYDRESIFLQTKPFGGAKYVKDGVMKPVGFFANNLVQEMEVSPHAVMLLKKSRRNGVWAGVTGFLSGIAFLGVLTSDAQNDDLWWLGTATLGLTSGLLSTTAQNQLNKSVWIYNRDVLNQSITNQRSLDK
ncbi:MAG: hypothetical protein AAGI23_18560 [Bacteroidota bacterium]